MANKTLKARLIVNNAVAAQWQSTNPIPLKGELCVENDTRKFKFGDGATPYNTLSYASAKMAEVKTTNPSASDNGYDIGQVWVNTSTKQAYMLLSLVSGSATWGRLITSADGSIAADTALEAGKLSTPHTIAGHSFDGTQDVIISATDVGAISTTEKGANGGVATLDTNGKVPSSQLPSYVDDVLEYSQKSAFPTSGETGKIYISQNDNKTWRWSGTAYVEISASLALGETSSTAYAGSKGKANATAIANHTGNTTNPHNVTKSQIGLGNVDNTSDLNKPISTATQTALAGKVGIDDDINIQKLVISSGDTLILDGSTI